MIIFEIKSKLNKKIRLTEENLKHIVFEHPEILFLSKNDFEDTLTDPDVVRRSIRDINFWLYYKFRKERPFALKYLTIGVKILNGNGFVVTAYPTDRIKVGDEIWRKN